jgi:hypothetical protein
MRSLALCLKASDDLSLDVHPADADVRLGSSRRLIGVNESNGTTG